MYASYKDYLRSTVAIVLVEGKTASIPRHSRYHKFQLNSKMFKIVETFGEDMDLLVDRAAPGEAVEVLRAVY